MFRIGEFARLAGVTTKRLRHYDQLDLFRPAWVDPNTGYRFYSPAQLPELYRIVTLKDLGLPLAEVATLVGEGADLADVLRRLRAELLAERRELERRLAALDIRVDLDGRSHHTDVVVRRLEPELVAGLRVQLDPGDDLEPIFNELETHVRDTGRRAPRPPASLVYRRDRGGGRDVEAVVPLTETISGTDRIRCFRLRGGRAAAVIHRGGYGGLDDAADTLQAWIAGAGLTPRGPLRIVYQQFGADASLEVPGPFLTTSAKDFVTEVQQTLAEPPG